MVLSIVSEFVTVATGGLPEGRIALLALLYVRAVLSLLLGTVAGAASRFARFDPDHSLDSLSGRSNKPGLGAGEAV
jgi:hypothetical protein